MRILHVIPQFPYFGGRTIVGGHASSLLSLAVAQHNEGEKVSILSYVEGHYGWRSIDDGPAIFSLFASARTRTVRFGLNFCRAAADWARRRRGEFDVIHVHSGYADYFLASSLLRSKVGKPVIHTLYCPIPSNGGRWRLPGVHCTLARWANRLSWCGGISQNVVNSMLDFGIKKAERVRPALDVQRLKSKAPDPTLRSRLGLGEDDLVVLFVGNAKPQKNLRGVLQAVHEVRRIQPNVRLVITTELKHSSSDGELAALARDIVELNLQNCVVQLGIVEDMPALMKACDVLVAPFLDTFGPSDYFMAALEAMACGKPVVVSAVGGMPEVISEEVGRLVNPRDFRSIARGILELLSDKELRLRAGQNAQRLVEQSFSQEAAVGAYRSVYEGVVS